MNYQWNEKEPSFLLAKLQTNEIHDSTGLVNLGQATTRKFTELSLGRLHASAWRSYPAKYKFFGLQINASDEKIVYKRVSYDLLQLFAHIGGVGVVFCLIACCVVSTFARINFNGMIGNRLYSWVPPTSLRGDSKREDSKMDVYEHTLFRKQRDDAIYARKLSGKGRHERF